MFSGQRAQGTINIHMADAMMFAKEHELEGYKFDTIAKEMIRERFKAASDVMIHSISEIPMIPILEASGD